VLEVVYSELVQLSASWLIHSADCDALAPLRKPSTPEFVTIRDPTPTASPYVREEAGTHRYNVGTDTPKLCATACGGVPLANSFLAA
jgi:hypothetical protein